MATRTTTDARKAPLARRCDAYTMRGASRRTLRAKLATTYRLHLYRGR